MLSMLCVSSLCFFFNDTAPTEIYTYLPTRSLHDALPIGGAEAAGEGIETGRHAASLVAGRAGVLHGNRTYVLADDDGQITETHSVSAGLDYPGVGRSEEHTSELQSLMRISYAVFCLKKKTPSSTSKKLSEEQIDNL